MREEAGRFVNERGYHKPLKSGARKRHRKKGPAGRDGVKRVMWEIPCMIIYRWDQKKSINSIYGAVFHK
jgi:hypothetical protein